MPRIPAKVEKCSILHLISSWPRSLDSINSEKVACDLWPLPWELHIAAKRQGMELERVRP